MYVIKADGTRERFEKDKIIRTCLRADTSMAVAEEIAEEIKKNVKEGTTTHEIYQTILSELRKRRDKSSFLFALREGISRLDSVSFELYVKKILETQGYECKWNVIFPGKCVDHQIDVIAKKEKTFLVECKHHVNYHRFCGLGAVLQVQARTEDVNDGFSAGRNSHGFDRAWIITNTKFSDYAKRYATAKNIRLTGWRYKDDDALERLIHSKKTFPITILRLGPELQRYLLEKGIITLGELMVADSKVLKKIEKDKLESLKKQAAKLLS